jgi:hypothetical protein
MCLLVVACHLFSSLNPKRSDATLASNCPQKTIGYRGGFDIPFLTDAAATGGKEPQEAASRN